MGVVSNRACKGAASNAEPLDKPQSDISGCVVSLHHGECQYVPLHIGNDPAVKDQRPLEHGLRTNLAGNDPYDSGPPSPVGDTETLGVDPAD